MVAQPFVYWIMLITKNYYKRIAIDLLKQQALYADSKSMQQINFTDNLEQDGNTAMFFIIQEPKETILDFSQGIVNVLQICSELIEYQYRMTQYNTLNEKLSNSQLKKLIRGIKTGTQVTLNPSSNVVGDSTDAINYPHNVFFK